MSEIRLQAREKDVDGPWYDMAAKIHVEAAREFAERNGLRVAVIETRDKGGSVTFPHRVEKVTGYRVTPLRGD